MSKVTLEREVITSKQARAYLEANQDNRNLRKALVAKLAGAIERGEWVETGDPIKFNGDGRLIDGQHRLEAIARSKTRVTVWVARGVSVEAQEVVDTGAARLVGDMLKLRGYTNAARLAAIARAVWSYRSFGQPLPEAQWVPPTHQQLLQLIEDEPVLTERTTAADRFCSSDPGLALPGGAVGGLMHLFAEKAGEEEAAAFFDQLLAPRNQTDATAVLRKRLLQHSVHSPIPKRIQLALTIKAWNAWLAGERPARLTWRSGGAKKEPFPEIHGLAE